MKTLVGVIKRWSWSKERWPHIPGGTISKILPLKRTAVTHLRMGAWSPVEAAGLDELFGLRREAFDVLLGGRVEA